MFAIRRGAFRFEVAAKDSAATLLNGVAVAFGHHVSQQPLHALDFFLHGLKLGDFLLR